MEIFVEDTPRKRPRKRKGSNPSKATRQLLQDYLGLAQLDGFVPAKNGVFCTTFNAVEYEHELTILCQNVGVCFTAIPDIRILYPFSDTEMESTPVLGSENGNYGSTEVSS